MATDLQGMILKQLKAMGPKFTLLLRKDAVAAGWPSKLVNSLKVVIDESGLSIEYSEENAEAIEDLEYGTYTSSPNPVMRLFLERHTDDFSSELADATIDALVATDVIP